jgi:Copper type II ascorbate-dependent monooxygenase, C-terminal domain
LGLNVASSFVFFVGVFAVRQQPYQILPGDSFSTTCFFSSNNNATFGESSSNEMCNSVILYYPAKRIFNAAPWICLYDTPLAACNATLSTSMVVTTSSELTTSSLTSTENALFTSGRYLDRTFGYSSVDECFANSPMSEGNTTSGATATLFLWSSLCFIAPTLTMLMFY